MSNKNDIKIIKALRAETNEAIARYDVEKLAIYWCDDVVLVRGNSLSYTGKNIITDLWQQSFRENPQVIYVRTPTEIIIGNNNMLAWETGTWKAINAYNNGGGNYSAMWKKLNNDWKIQAELFVSLF